MIATPIVILIVVCCRNEVELWFRELFELFESFVPCVAG